MAKWTGSTASDLKATVVWGDTLSAIARTASSKLGKTITYQQLASWNNISNPDLIYVDQVIKCYKSGSSGGSGGSSSSSKKVSDPNIKIFGRSAINKNQLVAAWDWSKYKNTEKYKVQWVYTNGSGVWFEGLVEEIKTDSDYPALSRQSVFNIPSGAIRVRFRVKPISKEWTKEISTEKERTDLFSKFTGLITGTTSTTTEKTTITGVHFKASWSEWKYYEGGETPDPPSAPKLEVDGSKLTATVDFGNVSVERATHVEFVFIKNNNEYASSIKSGRVAINSGVAKYKCTGADDSEYKVRARTYYKRTLDTGKAYGIFSDWSDYSETVYTKPSTPKQIKTIRADLSTQVYLSWTKVNTAEGYEIEYTEDKRYFDKSSQTSSVSIDENRTDWYVSGLQAGKEYFFRVRAIRGDNKSGWTGIKSIAVGTKPAAPTTWSSTSTVIEDADAILYWVHNSRDSSKQTKAQLKIESDSLSEALVYDLGSTVINNEYISYTPKEIDPEESEPTYECVLITDNFTEGAEIKWSVRTAGVKLDDNNKPEFGSWSTPRTIDVYTTPVAIIDVLDEVTSFPIDIEAKAGPNTDVQAPTGYHISIAAVEGYETVDNLGNFKMVKDGEEIYSEYYNPDTEGEVILELLPSSITLENGMRYIIKCVATMSSGLTAEASKEFTVSWEASVCEPNAEVGIDQSSLTASIRPYCERIHEEYRVVEAVNIGTQYNKKLLNISQFKEDDGSYIEYRLVTEYIKTDATITPSEEGVIVSGVLTDTLDNVYLYTNADGNDAYYTIIDGIYYTVKPSYTNLEEYTYGEIFNRKVGTKTYPVKLSDGSLVYSGVDDDSNEILFTTVDVKESVTDVWLSVYRREFDGRFTELAANLDGENDTTITDPHPALDYARYRIVAADKATGHIEYFDLPAHPVGGVAAVIQWDEEWTSFDAVEDGVPAQPALSGSMLKLPYNLDVSDSSKPENTLVEYIGRSHPVSYYGTQLGSSSSWSMSVPKEDIDTLYALRRLSRWLGDVYVREPSGSGYWAQVTVSFSQKHCDLIIPVTLAITRVEGGA